MRPNCFSGVIPDILAHVVDDRICAFGSAVTGVEPPNFAPPCKLCAPNFIPVRVVEVVKEVPIEVKGDTQIVIQEVIKEIPVEKIIEVKNDIELNALRDENERLKSELNNLTKSLESLGRKGKFMKDSNLSSLYGE